jgi:preprotein translocase subunit SecE
MASVRQMFGEVKSEFKKVKWPSKDESINVTILVVALSVGVGIYSGLFDYVFATLVKRLADIIGG